MGKKTTVMWYALTNGRRIAMHRGEELKLPKFNIRKPFFLAVEFPDD